MLGIGLVSLDLSWFAVQECDDGLLAGGGVLVFHLGIAFAIRPNRTITASDDNDVIVAIIYYPLDQAPLVFIGCGEEFHAGMDTVEVQQRLHRLLTVVSKITIGRKHEYLISFVHRFPLLNCAG